MFSELKSSDISIQSIAVHDHETNDRMYYYCELRDSQTLGDLFPQLSEEDAPFWNSHTIVTDTSQLSDDSSTS